MIQSVSTNISTLATNEALGQLKVATGASVAITKAGLTQTITLT